MDVYKINAIKQQIEVISQGSAKVKLELYSGLLDSTIGVTGLEDNILYFLAEQKAKRATGNSSVSARASEANISMPPASSAASLSSAASSTPSSVSRFSQASMPAVSSAIPSSAAYASMPVGGSGFAPQRIPFTTGVGGYALGLGPSQMGHRPLRAPLNLSGLKKQHRKTRRRNRQ